MPICLASGSEDGLNPDVFPLAVRLGIGERLTLVPIFRGSLFYCSNESIRNLVKSIERCTVVSYVNTFF